MASPKSWHSDHMGRHPLPVLESTPVIFLVSTALGFLSGLGVGGGSLLVLWLSIVLQTDPQTTRCINLLFFIPSALICCIFRIRQGKIHIKKLLPAMIAGSSCAVLFSLLSLKLDTTLLKKLFGLVLLVTGTREVFYRPRNAR